MAGDFTVFEGDALAVLSEMPANYAQVLMTSPPYWGLRDYGTGTWEGGDPNCDHKPGKESRVGATTLDGGKGTQGHQQEGYAGACLKCGAVRVGDQQIGLEDTPEAYVDRLVAVFRAARRVLRRDGIAVVVLGDTYASAWAVGRRNEVGQGSLADGKRAARPNRLVGGLKEKDLAGIPWRVALAMQKDGWYLRHALPWVKLNAMPNSQTDRPTTTTETVFVFSKSPKYYWDQSAVRVRSADGTTARTVRDTDFFMNSLRAILAGGRGLLMGEEGNPLAVVTNTAKFPQAHYATFPEELVEPFLRAGTSSAGRCPECGEPWQKVVFDLDDETPRWVEVGREKVRGKREAGRQGTKNRESHLGAPPQQLSSDIRARPGGQLVQWQPGCRCYDWKHCVVCGGEMDAFDRKYGDALDCGHNICAECLLQGGALDHECGMRPLPCVVLDPFFGSGTVGAVAKSMGLAFIGVELNPNYAAMARARVGAVTPPLPGLITW